jgi:hypothetical protein
MNQDAAKTRDLRGVHYGELRHRSHRLAGSDWIEWLPTESVAA